MTKEYNSGQEVLPVEYNVRDYGAVHEMARDEARHGKAFEGLLNRYFGK